MIGEEIIIMANLNKPEIKSVAIKLGLINEGDNKSSKDIITLIRNSINNVIISEPMVIDQPDDKVRLVQRWYKSKVLKYRYRQLLSSFGSQHQNIIQHAYTIFKCSCDVMKDSGPYCSEKHYQTALIKELSIVYNNVLQEKTETCYYRMSNGDMTEIDNGQFERHDVTVKNIETKQPTILELKATKDLKEDNYVQISNYIKNARRNIQQFDKSIPYNRFGMLINFSTSDKVTLVLTQEGRKEKDIQIYTWQTQF